ncbi:MAG: DMT family transporter [Firmicutes bacterium]|nr:DMT family transporter [Bacillota bacterium]
MKAWVQPGTVERPFVSPWVAIGLGVVAVSSASIFVRLSSAPPLVIATWRMGLATLMLAPFALVGGRREMLAMGRRDLALSLLAGGFLAVHFGAWMTSLSHTSVASSVVLVSMHPLFVMLASRLFFGESAAGGAVAGAVIAVVGSAIIGLGDSAAGGSAFFGDLLAVLSALMFAAYVLVGRGVRQRLSVAPYAFVVYGMCSLVLVLTCLAGGVRIYPYATREYVLFLALAAVPTILGHTVFNWALRYVSASVISVSVLGEPVGATVLAMALLKETPPATAVTGGILVIMGISLFTVFSARTPASAAQRRR